MKRKIGIVCTKTSFHNLRPGIFMDSFTCINLANAQVTLGRFTVKWIKLNPTNLNEEYCSMKIYSLLLNAILSHLLFFSKAKNRL